MSEEGFEEVSVVETEMAPVGGAGGGTEPTSFAAPESTPVEVMPAEVEATQVNLDAADDALKQNSQQAYLETFAPDRAGGAAPITLAGQVAKEESKEEKKAEAAEALQSQEKDAQSQREWMSRQHEFGGMQMSGQDLNKMMNFYANNPQMLDKLRDRMSKSGMSKDKVDKGIKEFQEGLAILKKEKDGTATEEDKRRYLELQKSSDMKEVSNAAVQLAKDNGVEFEANKEVSTIKTLTANQYEDIRLNAKESREKDINSKVGLSSNKNGFESFEGSEAARAHFASAPHLTNEFTTSNVIVAKAPAANDMSFGEDKPPVTIVADANRSKPALTADVSFG